MNNGINVNMPMNMKMKRKKFSGDALPVTENEWRARLTPAQYAVMREKDTEAPFSGKLLHEEREGIYRCAACGSPLFASVSKFDSGSGWPSFDEALPGAVDYARDDSYGMNRTEVMCANCHSHLGHIFGDGPTKSGKRYCMNSICLEFGESV